MCSMILYILLAPSFKCSLGVLSGRIGAPITPSKKQVPQLSNSKDACPPIMPHILCFVVGNVRMRFWGAGKGRGGVARV